MSLPSHYKLVEELPHGYEIHDSRDGKTFKIHKNQLTLDMFKELSNIKRFAKGGSPTIGTESMGYGEQIPLQAQSLAVPAYEPMGVGEEVITEVQPVIEPQPSPTPVAEPPKEQPKQEPKVEAKKEESKKEEPKKEEVKKEPEKEQLKEPTFFPTEHLKKERELLEKGAKAEAMAAGKTAAAYKEANDKLDKLKTPEEIFLANKDKLAELQSLYASSKINPNRIIDSMSDGKKIMVGIGAIFAGMGAGRGTNPVIEDLNRSIDRDIEAQKNEQEKKYNLWKMNYQATNSEMEANIMTRNQILSAVKAKAEQYANQYAGPQAMAKIAPILAQIDQEMQINLARQSLLETARTHEVIDRDPTNYLHLIKDKEVAKRAAQEIEEMDQIKRLQEHVLRDIDYVASVPWYMKGSAITPAAPSVTAAKKNGVGTLTKYLENTYTKEQAHDMAESFFDNMIRSNTTPQFKRDEFIDLVRAKQKGVNFQAGTGIPLEKFSRTNLSNAPAPAPGIYQQPKSNQEEEQKKSQMHEYLMRQTFKQYYEKHKNSTNPEQRKKAQEMKDKYGF